MHDRLMDSKLEIGVIILSVIMMLFLVVFQITAKGRVQAGERLTLKTGSVAGVNVSDIEFESLPLDMKDIVYGYFGNDVPFDVEKITQNDVISYEISTHVNGLEHEIELAVNNELLELEHELPAYKLPDAVKKALAAEYPGSAIRKSEVMYKRYYEIEIESDNQYKELVVLPYGKVFENH